MTLYNLGVPLGKKKNRTKQNKNKQKRWIRHPLSTENESGIHYPKSAIHSVAFRTQVIIIISMLYVFFAQNCRCRRYCEAVFIPLKFSDIHNTLSRLKDKILHYALWLIDWLIDWLLLSRSIKLWNAVHIMSSIGRIT